MGHPAALAFAARLPAGVAGRPGRRRDRPRAPAGAGLDAARRARTSTAAGTWTRVGRALWPLSEADAAGAAQRDRTLASRRPASRRSSSTRSRCRRCATSSPSRPRRARPARRSRKQIPKVMWRDCRPCKAQHVSDSAMRSATPAAGLEIEPGTAPPVLVPRAKAKPAATAPTTRRWPRWRSATSRCSGPAGPGDFAGYLEARRADVRPVWPDDELAEVSVDGRAGVAAGRTASTRCATRRSPTSSGCSGRSIRTCRPATAT